MAKINGLMDIGKRGMAVSQTAIQTTSHNIANRTTEGFSRQRVETSTSPAIDQGRYRIGTGTQLSAIQRTNNPWIEKQIEREGSQFAFYEGQSQALGRIENALNEQSVKGLNSSISDFFGAFRELANNPESSVPRVQVREAAINLIKTFQDTKRQIDDVGADINKTVDLAVNEANSFASEIADLNIKIRDIEVGGGPANDERDRRDLLVKKLSEKLDISYAEDPKSGMLNITAGDTGMLVAGTSAGQLKTGQDEAGNIRIYSELSKGGTRFDITDQFSKGAIGGALGMRHGVLSDMGQQLENLAFNIAANVNRVHQEGFDRYDQSGIQFFDMPITAGQFSIDSFKLSDDIMKDVGRIAAAAKMGSPGDNATANVIQELQFQPLMEGGKYSFDDFYNSKVGEIGLLTNRANSALESQKNTLDQLKNVRESISGVSLDEEAAKMIEYQKSYEASARMIKVADEMFDTVLNLKRL